MRPIENNALSAHVQRLRKIFDRRVETKFNDSFQIRVAKQRGGLMYLSIQANGSTENVINDQDRQEVCAVLRTMGQRRVLCSYVESWCIAGKDRFGFNSTSLTFFLTFPLATATVTKQVFRLEWDNWQNHPMPNRAAYPHWQFDRWLTASDTQQLAELREVFAADSDQAVDFEAPDQHPGRPDLSWFTKVHFPSIAPWATSPILDLNADPQPHRSVPNSPQEIESWVDSALCYLHSEITAYGPK